LLLGVEYDDGRTATTFGGRFGWEHDDGSPVLNENGGGGGGHRYDMSYWLNPLPTGDLTVVCAWPGQGIDETRTVIPGDAIATARAAVVELWPWEPEPEPETPPESPPVELPPGSWFAGKFPPSPQQPGDDSGWVRYGPSSE
jgi:hypothetical protein